ncbi:MAG: HAMP domain-containing sensor histidine kinase [Cyanobacteria bacterium P01_H01_bin.121]
MNHLRLRSRLFLSYLLVLGISLSCFIAISKASSSGYFTLYLHQLEGRGIRVHRVQSYVEKGFSTAWQRSTLWAMLVGGSTAVGLSYWVARRITRPLTKMEAITQQLASGRFQELMPASDIPELNRLSTSFNQMAQDLQAVEVRRRQLIGDVSHELRTPLTVMRGYLEEMLDGSLTPTPQTYVLLIQETKRLERLTSDLQDLSQAEIGHLALSLKPLELYPLLEHLQIKLTSQIPDADPELLLVVEPNLPRVLADRDRTEQILSNLLSNALRYTPTGTITLKAWSDLTHVWLAVVDTGIGIKTDELEHIFERFWRSPQARQQNPGGTGIGLAIARRLVELQGGTMQVDSEIGMGSTFAFSLPRTDLSGSLQDL